MNKLDKIINKLDKIMGYSILGMSLFIGSKIGWVGEDYTVKMSLFGVLAGLCFLNLKNEQKSRTSNK